MTATSQLNTVVNGNADHTAKELRNLYFTRAAFSVSWVIIVSLFAKGSLAVATVLLIIYPEWDVIGTFLDIRANRHNNTAKTPQYVNIGISTVTTIAIAFALQKGIPMTLMVFGAWAILTGLIQFILGLSRKKSMSGQWPMIISGAQSIVGGTINIILAHNPSRGITSLATYVAFGAFYYLLAGYNLSKTVKKVSLAA